MNDPRIDKLVGAVLYEGFILYPYRPSLKSAHRWTFGGLYPREFCEAQGSVESPSLQVQCLIVGDDVTRLEVVIRFLRLVHRQIGRFAVPLPAWPADDELEFVPVESMAVGDRQFHSWQEAAEQTLDMDSFLLDDLVAAPRRQSFSFPHEIEREPILSLDGQYVGVIERRQCSMVGSAEVAAEKVAEDCFRLTLRAVNETQWESSAPFDRDEAALRSFAAAHAIITVHGGELLSQIDPPDRWRGLVAANRNVGTWPVLIGEPPARTTMLAAPILLGDYPEIAPESPTALFDSTEIDEILALRIMTLTDAEKLAMRAIDPRSRELLTQIESLSPKTLLDLHGVWVQGMLLTPGERVRLKPRPGGDILDLVLAEKVATITSIEQDFEGQTHVAVTVDDDPGRDFGQRLKPGHRFFFRLDEVEPVDRVPRSDG